MIPDGFDIIACGDTTPWIDTLSAWGQGFLLMAVIFALSFGLLLAIHDFTKEE